MLLHKILQLYVKYYPRLKTDKTVILNDFLPFNLFMICNFLGNLVSYFFCSLIGHQSFSNIQLFLFFSLSKLKNDSVVDFVLDNAILIKEHLFHFHFQFQKLVFFKQILTKRWFDLVHPHTLHPIPEKRG